MRWTLDDESRLVAMVNDIGLIIIILIYAGVGLRQEAQRPGWQTKP